MSNVETHDQEEEVSEATPAEDTPKQMHGGKKKKRKTPSKKQQEG